MSIYNFIVQRLFQAVFVALIVTLFVSFMIRLTGDPAVMIMGSAGSFNEADLVRIREALGLNQSFFRQYANFIGGLLTGDLGTSFYRGQVSGLLAVALPATLLLAFSSLAVSVLISLPLGIHAAIHKGGIADQIIRIASLVGLSFPNFWLAMMLVLIFSIIFPIFPASGYSGSASLVLPAITNGVIMTAINVRLVRTTMIETLSQQYIMVARSKGLRERVIVYKHALRNCGIALVTYLGLQFGSLIGGLVVVELVFNWPGMGTLAIDAIAKRDYPVLQATITVLALMIIAVNFIVDLLYGLIDPRIRVE